MAVEKVRQQRTPGQFGIEATGLSTPSYGAASYSSEGVVERSKAIKYEGIAKGVEGFGKALGMSVDIGADMYKGYQLADVQKEHEKNIQDYIESKKNPQIAKDAAVDAFTLEQESHGLWATIGEGTDISQLDKVEEAYQGKLKTMKNAVDQGVMSADEFSQRSLAITREAINRNPHLANDILNHTKKVLNLSGVDSLLEAEQKQAQAGQAQYEKRVAFNMQQMNEHNLTVRYDAHGNYDIAYGEEQVGIANREKRAAALFTTAEVARTAEDKKNQQKAIGEHGYDAVNGMLREQDTTFRNFMSSPDFKGDMTVVRDLAEQNKRGISQQLAQHGMLGVEEGRNLEKYAHARIDATVSLLEKANTKEDQMAILKNTSEEYTHKDNIKFHQTVKNPKQTQLLMGLFSSPNWSRYAAENPADASRLRGHIQSIIPGAINSLGTNYSLKMPNGQNATAYAVEEFAGPKGKDDPAYVDGLSNTINTIYGDKDKKFNSAKDRYTFYDTINQAVAKPGSAEGFKTLDAEALGKMTEMWKDHLDLTTEGYTQDIPSITNKGTSVQWSVLPNGGVYVKTSNQSDTDYLNKTYTNRINTSIKAYANMMGVSPQQAAKDVIKQSPILQGLFPEEGGEGKKKVTGDFGNRPDGSKKGSGFLGEIKSEKGNTMTEYSVGVNIGGKDMDIPTFVPGLTDKELNFLKTEPELRRGDPLSDSIMKKAVDHAKRRIEEGKSPFAAVGESPNKKQQEEGKPNESNPLNLTIPGKTGKFQKFESTEEGIRAASVQLDRYFTGKTPGTGSGLNTLDQIGGKWNNENEAGSTSKKNYVATLVKHMGVGANEPLDLNDPNTKADLIYAMSVAEGRPLKPSLIMSALGK